MSDTSSENNSEIDSDTDSDSESETDRISSDSSDSALDKLLCKNKDAMCLKIITKKRPKSQYEIPVTEGFDFGAALLSKYDIIVEILKYLNYSDLKSLSKLGNDWKVPIDECLSKRLEPNVFNFVRYSFDSTNDEICSYAKPMIGIVFFNHHECRMKRQVCMHVDNYYEKQVLSPEDKVIKKLRNKKERNIKVAEKKTVHDFIRDDIFGDKEMECPLIVLSCQQPRHTSLDGRQMLRFNGMSLPTVPGVTVNVIPLQATKKSNISNILRQYVNDNYNVSCLLTFSTVFNRKDILKRLRPLVDVIKERQPLEAKFAFGGAVVTGTRLYNIFAPGEYKKSTDLVCVFINVPKVTDMPFDSYSFIITEDMISNKMVESEFLKFKAGFRQRKHSVAFRFLCLSLRNHNSEVCKIYDKVVDVFPIMGFSCNGEFGWNTAPMEPSDDLCEPSLKKAKPLSSEPLLNYYTICYVILTWGKEIVA